MNKILVTGGAGFIGSAFVRQAIKSNNRIIVVDKLTYAGDLKRLEEVKGKYKFHKADIRSTKRIESIIKTERPDYLVNFAAESHVDRSIKDAWPFIETNVLGVQVLLKTISKYKIKKFIQISTDEVYGSITNGCCCEDSVLNPSSPYSASKAAADLLINAYIKTFDFPAIIIRPCNNYGPWQYPEKFIPLAISNLIKGKKIPIYGKGINIREWIHVEDCARGIYHILKKGKIGEIYNLGSGFRLPNIKLTKMILKILNVSEKRFRFVKDRPGHDLRYGLNSNKLRRKIDWQPLVKFNDGLREAIAWYLKNKKWLSSKHSAT